MNVEKQNLQNRCYRIFPHVLKVKKFPGGVKLEGSYEYSYLTFILDLLNPVHTFKPISVRSSF
jgi:hypothetical protein